MGTNRSKFNLVLALVALAAICLSCTFLKGRSGNSPYGIGDIHKSPLPSFDGNEPFPAISTDAINALVMELPELAKHRDKILEAERSAINGIFAEIQAKSRNNNVSAIDSNVGFTSSRFDAADDNFSAQFSLIPTAYAADDPPAMPDMGGLEFFVIGHQAGFLTPDFDKVPETSRGHSKIEKLKSDSTGEVIATTTTTISTDGSVTSEISTNINMPVMGLNASSKVKIQGNHCPTSDGKIDLTIELSTNGRAGSSGSTIYDKTITAKLKATVNDNAEIATIDFDLKQAQRSTAGGRQVYVETSQTGRSANGTYSGLEFGDVRIDRTSSQVKAADAELSQAGLRAAFNLAEGLLENAKERWRSGGCVQIVADSPGAVAVSSTTQIPVKVTHLVDRSEVPSKLEAVLSGESSVEPTLIPKTAGTLTYTAPGESGKSATIKLTATSKRGKATLDLTVSTGGNSYQIVGGLDDWQTNTKVCDIMKPFTLTGLVTMRFSGGLSGSYEYSGGPFNANGRGTYTISLPNGIGEPGTMTGSGPGEVTGDKVYKGSGTEKYTLTPIEPCSQ